MTLRYPLVVKNLAALVVIAVLRISTLNQMELSLDDQLALLKTKLAEWYKGPVRWILIRTQASGEWLDREELIEIRQLVAQGDIDLVVAEDLGRIMRDMEALSLCGYCVDHSTRVIAINDHLDTAEDDWRRAGIFAAFRHEGYNEDTSKRIKQRLRNRFVTGNLPPRRIAGYLAKKNPKTEQDVWADPLATPIVEEVVRRLRAGQNYSDIADYLNEIEFPVGPNCRKEQWDGKMVRAWITNPLIGGVHERNRRHTVKRYQSGKRESVQAPVEMLGQRYCEHLAHLPREDHEALLRFLDERNGKYKRADEKENDPVCGRPKKRTRFPGQMCRCGICNYPYVWGGHGQTDHLMCNGARHHHCWNGVSFDGVLGAQKIAQAVFREIENLKGFDPAFIRILMEEAEQADTKRLESIRRLEHEVDDIRRRMARVEQQIMDGYAGQRLGELLQELEKSQSLKKFELKELTKTPSDVPQIPGPETLKDLSRNLFADLAVEGYEFGRQLKMLVPRIVIFPYRRCDNGTLVTRARFRLHLANLLPDPRLRDVLGQPLERELVVDLFEPPQPVAYREQVTAARRHMTEAQAAAQCGITVTAAQHAAKLQRAMDRLGITDPYVPLLDPPDDHPKLRRHLHPRYSFRPKPAAGE